MMKKGKKKFGYMSSSPDRYRILKDFARQNRLNMTTAESILWTVLRSEFKSFHFRRQHIIGDFIVDFACIRQHLIIEVDGGYHSEPRQQKDDLMRTEYLKRMNYNVIRFTNDQIIWQIKDVEAKIKTALHNKQENIV